MPETAIQFNFKVGRDGLMVNLYAADPDDAAYLLGYVSDNVDEIVKTQAAFDAANNLLGVGAQPASGWQSANSPSAPPASAPQGGAAPCPHGPRQHRASKPGSSTTWSGWFCAAGIKECKPVWDPKR